MHCNLRRPALHIAPVVRGLFLTKFVLRNTHMPFPTSGKNSDTAVGFDDLDFQHGADILAIGGHLLALFWQCFDCACTETATSGCCQKADIAMH